MAITVNKTKPGEVLVKPNWIKAKAPGSPKYLETKEIVDKYSLNTVCEEAHCPNIGECWSHHTATFMIMGEFCTRRCRFCSIKDSSPTNLDPLDPLEPFKVSMAVKKLNLKHVVVTSVDRDDLIDRGSNHFVKTAEALKQHCPGVKIEFLIPDFEGIYEHIKDIALSGVNILNHNVETVPRLYKRVRPGSGYIRSVSLLKTAKEVNPKIITKSGIMVGLSETKEEVLSLMDDLREANVDIMTIGQYLRPTAKQMPVHSFITPEEFKEYERIGLSKGFKFVESGPLVRSSYHAWKHSENIS